MNAISPPEHTVQVQAVALWRRMLQNNDDDDGV